ncbi:DUF3857 domain-containing protein [Rasiella rasia]|uniref:DUF3857 domain-containing protein n=1 Tax=Rasiella rasia TaxID=2744027 RepID=A0A6G6GKL8_9FLAO|nr:DUF3857 domain-containing protein [Rasiella rasia]QIE59102.1 DUF3857 domain-containing protein [Rasiella rasia]
MVFQQYFLAILFITTSISSFGQTRQTADFGNPTSLELTMTSYPNDSEAAGVVLFEKGKTYVKLVGNYVRLIKEVHRKTKVLDAKNFTAASVGIPYYIGSTSKEKVTNVEAITHNKGVKKYVAKDAYFTTNEVNQWNLKRFTFPDVQDGSVLEYRYTIESPFFGYLDGWDFQSTMPKVYTEFVSEIPGNYNYRRSLVGTLKLEVNEVSLKEDCFFIPSYEVNADCEVAVYAMKDVPAFKKESYMLSEKNYMARVGYELKEYYDFKGNKTEVSKEWKDVDKEFRTDKDLGRQLGSKNFFENKLPPALLSEADPLAKAKGIFYFIQQHFNYNGKQRILSDIRVKEAFEEKVGNSSEINLSLVNALNVANLDAKVALIATRSHALPTKLYPVLTDFNYAIVYLKIGDKEYLLDATSKYIPFGFLPSEALNHQARVLDLKEGSFWVDIVPEKKNVEYINAQLELTEENTITGKVAETYVGYPSVVERIAIASYGSNEFKNEKQKYIEDATISSLNIEHLNNLSENLKETYTIEISPELAGGKWYVSPFFLTNFYNENPFKLTDRTYPVDFGYPVSQTFLMSLDLKGKYNVVETPQNTIVKLPNGAGECSVVYGNTGDKITVRFSFKLNQYYFTPEKYKSLQDFFDTVVTMLNKEVMVLEKI